MKKCLLVSVCSFALLSVSAVAGATCLYGHGDGYAKVEKDPIKDALAKEKVDPNLLALIKKQQAAEQVPVNPIVVFN